MSDKTKIQWTDTTWNPVRGCSRVSAGCMNCYAETMAARFSGPGQPYEGLAKTTPSGPRWTGKVVLVPEHLGDPLRWKRPRMVFVNSMSDLFHEGFAFDEIARIFAVMHLAQQHVFQVLTKRAARMAEFFRWLETEAGRAAWLRAVVSAPDGPFEGWSEAWPFRNIWLGVSVEDQKSADERIPLLLETPAAVRWVSFEPALGPVDFEKWTACACPGDYARYFGDDPHNHWCPRSRSVERKVARLDWIVVGGESGHGARPFDVEWARETVRACKAAGVPVFVKQLGARAFSTGFDLPKDACNFLRLASAKGGDPEEWPEDLRVREWPGVSA